MFAITLRKHCRKRKVNHSFILIMKMQILFGGAIITLTALDRSFVAIDL